MFVTATVDLNLASYVTRDGSRAQPGHPHIHGIGGALASLAADRLASRPQIVRPVAGFTPVQHQAYKSCLATGVRLVWGPPGTGKTRVLSQGVSVLLGAGLRVLLVSATNILSPNWPRGTA